MKIRRFFGKDMREALKQVKDELGGDAVIMSNKKVNGGVELVVAVEKASQTQAETAHHVSIPEQNAFEKEKTPSLKDIIGEDGPDTLKALLDKQKHSFSQQDYLANDASIHAQVDTNEPPRPVSISENLSTEIQFDTKDSDPFFEPKEEQSLGELNSIRNELESIRNVLEFQVSNLSDERTKRSNPMHGYLSKKLFDMGISDEIAQQLIKFVPQKGDEKTIWNRVLNLLSTRIQIGGNEILQNPGVVSLVGPTGSGKTTTIAKLAAKYAQKYGPDSVALITLDTYRIAAYEQLATYGRIIGCAVKKAQNAEELNHQLYQFRNKKLVLIDTAGFSQRDERLISQLSDYETGLSVGIRKYLVLPANAQHKVLQQTVNAYHNVKLNGCIISKLDECYSLGEALSAVIQSDLPLNYVTDGQRVPEDIKLADAKNLTLVATKLYKKYVIDHTNEVNMRNSVRAL